MLVRTLSMVVLLLGARGVRAADWVSVGPDGGQIDRVAFEPGDASTFYATNFGGGLFKSTDGGASWAQSDIGPGLLELTLVTDPAHPGTVYTNSFDTIWKSTDGGVTWAGSPTGLTFIVALELDPSNPQRLIAGGLNHVAISTDGGATWTVHGNFASGQVFHAAFDPVTPSTIYVTSAGFPGGVHRSLDGGATFTQVLSLFDPEGVAVDPLTPTTVFAWGTEIGIRRSLDGGGTWSHVGSGVAGVAAGGLVIDAGNPSILYALTDSALFQSTDGGSTFSPFGGAGLIPGALSHLVRDPGNPARFAAGSGDGVGLSVDGGLTWTHHKNGFHLHYVPALAAAPSDPTFLYAGSPIVGAWTSSDQGTTWTSRPLVDGVASLTVDPMDAGTAYATPGAIFSPGIVLKTTDHGDTWTEQRAGLESLGGLTSVAVAPSMPSVLYLGAENGFPGVVRSVDAGLTWSPTNGPPGQIFAVAVDPTNPDHVFAASAQLVYRTFDGGANWGAGGVPGGFSSPNRSTLVVDPTNPSRIYYGVNAYPYGMFVSNNGGISFDLTLQQEVNAIAVIPSVPGLVLIGTPSGVSASGDSGQTWQDLSGDLAGQYIDAIALVPGSPVQAFVGTEGLSVWRRTVAQCTTDADCDDNSLCTTDACAPGQPGSDALGCRHDAVICPDADECHQSLCSPYVGCIVVDTLDFTPCTSDGLPCTIDQCKGGVCDHAPRVVLTCTQAVAAGGAKINVKNTDQTKRALKLRLGKLSDTPVGRFGNPLTTNASDYALCVFDHSGAGGTDALVFGVRIPAGEMCGARPCWATHGTGFSYRDPERTPDGIDKMSLVPGLGGKARITASAKGANLPLTPGGMDAPVTVQIQRDDDPTSCWGATFDSGITLNDGTLFRATGE